MTTLEIELLISRLLDELHSEPRLNLYEAQTVVRALTLMIAVRNVEK